jgi:hypothetical protein
MTRPGALDIQPGAVESCEDLVVAAESSGSALGPDGRRMLEAIEDLSEGEHEVFGLVRILSGEAGMVAGLRHTIIVQVDDVGEPDGRPKPSRRRLGEGSSTAT